MFPLKYLMFYHSLQVGLKDTEWWSFPSLVLMKGTLSLRLGKISYC